MIVTSCTCLTCCLTVTGTFLAIRVFRHIPLFAANSAHRILKSGLTQQRSLGGKAQMYINPVSTCFDYTWRGPVPIRVTDRSQKQNYSETGLKIRTIMRPVSKEGSTPSLSCIGGFYLLKKRKIAKGSKCDRSHLVPPLGTGRMQTTLSFPKLRKTVLYELYATGTIFSTLQLFDEYRISVSIQITPILVSQFFLSSLR